MGAWGIGNFENDDAVDWTYDIADSKGVNVLLSPLRNAVKVSDYLEAPDCCQALASAEIIGKCLSQQISDLPEDIQVWLKQKKGLFGKVPVIERAHAPLAAAAVKRILSDSELTELWQESAEFDQWRSGQEQLLDILERFSE